MSLMINQNVTALNAWRNLSKTDRAMSSTMEKLSSGLRINRAADDPAGLVISEQMRAQVVGLKAAIKNSEKGISMVQTAEAALDKTHNLLDKLRGLALDSANAAVNDGYMLAANQAEVTNILQTISRIADYTQYGTKKLLDGSNALQTTIDSRANGIDSVVSANAQDGSYTLTVAELTPGFISMGTTLVDTGLAYEGGTPTSLLTGLSSGTHTIALTGARETFTRSASTLTAPDTVATTPAGGIAAGAGLDTAALSRGTHTVALTGALDTVGGFAVSGGTLAVGTLANATYDGALTGTAAGTGAFTFTNGTGSDTLDLEINDASFTWAGGGQAGTATWTNGGAGSPGVLTITEGANTYRIEIDLSGTVTDGSNFTLDVTASTAAVQLNGDALNEIAINRLDLGAGTYSNQAVTDGTDTVHADLSGVTAANLGTSNLTIVKAAGTAGNATVSSAADADHFYTGSAAATYRLTVANDFTAGGATPTLTNDDFSVTSGGVAVAATLSVSGSTVTVAASDGSFTFDFTMDAGDYTAGGTFDVTLGASTAKLVLDGNVVGAGTIYGNSTDLEAAGAGTDTATFDVSGATLGTSGSFTVNQTTYTAQLSSTVGGPGTAVNVTTNQTRLALSDNATNNNGGANTLTVNFGGVLAAGTSNINLVDQSLVFQIGANQGQTVKVAIQSVAATSLAVKANAAAGTDLAGISSPFASLDDIDVTTAQGAQDALVMIDAAIDEVSQARGELGAFQANTLEAQLDSLRVAAENLQASESVIRDTDMAAEMATFTKNQIMMQAGTAMLAQANQIPQNLLQLLQG